MHNVPIRWPTPIRPSWIGGSVIGLSYIYLAKKDFSTYEVPFGTFLGVAALAVSFWVR